MSLLRACLLALILGNGLRAQSVSLSARLDRTEITVGDQARLELALTWGGAADAFTVEEWAGPECSGVGLPVESDQVQTRMDNGKPVYCRKVVYLLRGDVAGQVSSSPARVRLKGADGRSSEYKTQALMVIVQPEPHRIPWGEIALVVLGVLVLIIALRVARRTNRRPPPVTKGAKARKRVEELATLGGRDYREFFDGCLNAVREGLAEELNLEIKDRDRAKVVRAMADAGCPETLRQSVEELFTMCDEARFSPDPPHEGTRSRALKLVETILSISTDDHGPARR